MKDVLARIAAKCPERFEQQCDGLFDTKKHGWVVLWHRDYDQKIASLIDEFNLYPLLGNYEGTLAERALRALADKLEGEEEARG